MTKEKNQIIISHSPIRYLLLTFGTIFLCLGIIGIIIPLLPTTPFLLLSAACYARSSTKFYHWLLHNKWFGNYIKYYYEGRGIPIEIKFFTIVLLWWTILISIFFFIDLFLVKIIMLLIAILISIHILLIKTYHQT
jgi:uncharacterized membrane protein YbaN (DUF454 family)